MSAVEIILTFSIGGITLRGAIAQLKKWLKVQGFLALLLSLGCCVAASAAYILITKGDWANLLLLASEVFVGTQVAYRATKK